MKTAGDVVKRIQWDSEINEEYIVVGYLDRFVGIKECTFNTFDWGDIVLADLGALGEPFLNEITLLPEGCIRSIHQTQKYRARQIHESDKLRVRQHHRSCDQQKAPLETIDDPSLHT